VHGRPLEFRNTNLLVDKDYWHVTVQKTGYVAYAGRCLVMQAIIDGRDVVIVLLNSWGTLTRIGDANRVRRWIESSVVRAAPGPARTANSRTGSDAAAEPQHS
jgi:D-alanyl-D-alanine endopeptidase (penicillin-binding protein 7)